ncbi:Deoxyribonuclease-2 [Halotydeus destructor]|nr:Deoxyribonuclease-2 [Halotydeus destructor]
MKGALLISFLLSVQLGLSWAAIYCQDEQGNDVDWWISYKIPRLQDGAGDLSTGFSYAYIIGKPISGRGGNIKGWKLSDKLITDPKSLFGITTAPIYATPSKYATVMYNDDPPEGAGKESGSLAHAKGVLTMDKETGFWLIHSVPNFFAASAHGYEYPASGKLNGQTLMCISFDSKKHGENIAKQLLLMRPNLYNADLADEYQTLAPSLWPLAARKWEKTETPSVYEVKSIKGESFTSFSRNAKAAAHGDLYSLLVAPKLDTDLIVETWRRGAGTPLESNCTGGDFHVMNVDTVNLPLVDSPVKETGAWKYLSDHAKWAVAATADKPFTCIGDINRMKSQFKRGGGTVCFKSPKIWSIARDSIAGLEACTKA